MSVDTLRETFHINRISAEKIQDFLTAQTYRPEITRAKEKIRSLPWAFLQDVCSRPIRQGKSPSYADGYGLTCIKPKHTTEMIVSLDRTNFIDPSTKDEVAGQRLKNGDIVITRSGAGTIGRASLFLSDAEVYTNDHLFIVRTDKADSHYTCVFLTNYWGQRLLEAGVSGSTGQLNLSNEHIKTLMLFTPHELAQRYIGDKVRQAERLQAWAKVLRGNIAACFAFLIENPLAANTSWRTKEDLLDSYRINPKHYDPVVLDLLHRSKRAGVRLQPLGELVSARKISGGATPKGAKYQEKGVLFVRVQNVKSLSLDLSDAVFIDESTDEELGRSRCAAGDLILTITGYPGTASLVTEEDLPVNINQHSVRFGIRADVGNGFVCAALNSRFVKYQVDRLAIGGTREALDYPSVANLLIPRLGQEIEKEIDNFVHEFVGATKLSQRLINTARVLVEVLIEGKINEKSFVASQKALESGDNSLDREMLFRLKIDGLDGKGDPLFPDLDCLYDLLEQAEQAVAE